MLAGGDERGDHMRHLATQLEKRLHGVGRHIELATAGPRLVQGALSHRVADGACLFDDGHLEVGLDPARLLHDGVAIHQLQVRQMRSHRVDERDVGLIDGKSTRGQTPGLEKRDQDVPDEPIDQLPLLHDGDGMCLPDPAHSESGLVDLATRSQQDRIVIGSE